MAITTKCLITGGAGFIGSNLADELIRQGARVRIIDDFSTGFRENQAIVAILSTHAWHSAFVGAVAPAPLSAAGADVLLTGGGDDNCLTHTNRSAQ